MVNFACSFLFRLLGSVFIASNGKLCKTGFDNFVSFTLKRFSFNLWSGVYYKREMLVCNLELSETL